MKALEKLHSSMPIKWSFDLLFDSKQLKMSWKLHFDYCYWGECLHTEWYRKLNFGMDNGSDLYFHNLNMNWRERHAGTPLSLGSNPQLKHWKKSGHVTYKMKALGKLYSNMPIKWFGMDISSEQFFEILQGGGRGQSTNQNIWNEHIWSCDTSNEIPWGPSN